MLTMNSTANEDMKGNYQHHDEVDLENWMWVGIKYVSYRELQASLIALMYVSSNDLFEK